MSWVAVAVGAGVGLIGGAVKANHDSAVSAYQGKVEGAKERYSVFTGQHANPVEQANPWGDVIGGTMAGAQAGAAFGNGMAQKDYTEAATGWLNRGGNPGYTSALAGSGATGALTGMNYNQPTNSFWGVDNYPGGVAPLEPAQASQPYGLASSGWAPTNTPKSKLGIF